MKRLAPALLWAATSALLLVVGLAGLLRLVTRGLSNEVAGLVFRALVQQALLPLWLVTLASWLVLARFAPAVEHSWWRLALGLVLVTVLWFPLVGEFSFHVWQPTNAVDYFGTWLLVAGGVSSALLVARRLLPWLRPGTFATPSESSTGSS